MLGYPGMGMTVANPLQRSMVVQFLVLAAISQAWAGCPESALQSPASYFPRELGVVRHYEGVLKYGDTLVSQTSSYSDEYLGRAVVDGRVAEKFDFALVVTWGGTEVRVRSYYFVTVGEHEIREIADMAEGEAQPTILDNGGAVVLAGPLVAGNEWKKTTSELITLADVGGIEGLESSCAVVATNQSVEVAAGVFECCVVVRSVGTSVQSYDIVGLSGRHCDALIRHEVETTYAPGVGVVLVEKRQFAIPKAYPDSVFSRSVYRAELVEIESR